MRLVIALVVLAAAVYGVVYWRQQVAAKEAAAAAPEVETAEVQRKDLAVTVSASGVIEPLTTVEVKSRSGGEVKRLLVEAGDVVKAGQLIAQLDPTNLRNKAAQAAANVSARQAETTQARLQATLQEAQTTGDLAKARAGVASARASLQQAEEQLRQERESTASALQQAEAGLKSARVQLAKAQAEEEAQPSLTAAAVENAQAALEASRQNLARLRAGARPQEVAEAEAALRSAEAGLRNAEQTLKRQEALLVKGFTAAQTVDDARKARDQALANRDQAQQALELLQAGSRAEEIAQAQAQVAQAEASLKLAKANSVQVGLKQREVEVARQGVAEAEAALAAAQAQRRNVQVREKQVAAARAALQQAEATLRTAEAGKLADAAKKQQIQVAAAALRSQSIELNQTTYDLQYASVVAPRSGVIMEKLVEEGTVVPAGTAALKEGTTLVTIADTSEMYMLADVDEADMAGVRVGQACEITASVLPNEKMKGSVVKIFPQGKTDQNVVRFQVRVRIINPAAALRPGMTADVTIRVAERKQVLVVPDNAITRKDGEATVEVQGAEGQTEKRTVKVGLSNWDETEIIAGVKEGEKVVLPAPPSSGDQGPFGKPANKQEENERKKRRMMMQFRMRQGN